MTLRIDPPRRLAWGLAGLVVLLGAGLCWSLVRWQHAERQVQLAQQQLAEQQYAQEVAAAQRALESAQEQPRIRILGPADTKAILGLPASDGPGVPAHIDAGMLIDGIERNSKRAIKKAEPLERRQVVPNGGRVPKEIDEGMILDGLQRVP